MKKLIAVLTITLLTLSSNLTYSEELEPEKMVADDEYVMSLLRQCQDYALEDEVTAPNMQSYLLTCVNDELEGSYYKRITVLPKDES